jgi:hypothetical protein
VLHAPERDANQVAGLDVVSALVEVFDGLMDRRLARGIRHGLASVLTIAVLAVLAGASNCWEVGDRASELPNDLLVAAGGRMRNLYSSLCHRSPTFHRSCWTSP